MPDQVSLSGNVVTNIIPNIPAGAFNQPTVNNLLQLRTVQGLPPLAELVRLGVVWDLSIATGSAFTYVAAIPTTRAELVVYNGNPAGGPSLIWISAFMQNVTSQAAANPINLMVQNVPQVATIPTDDTAQLIASRSGRTGYAGRIRRAVANTAAGQTTNLWRSVVSSPNAATATVGLGLNVDLFGAWITPPGGVMAFAGVAGTAAGTAIIGACFAEIQIDMQL